MKCPLCTSEDGAVVATDKRRSFILCSRCSLVFVPEVYHLSIDQERSRYALHDNRIENSGYVRFLEVLGCLVSATMPADSRLLDYGCGENAVLTELLRKRERDCVSHDPLYPLHDSGTHSGNVYDGVILSEVIEHCREVRRELVIIGGLLSPAGKVFIRTRWYPEPAASITGWWYAQDMTHINFFSEKALGYVAEMLGKKLTLTAQEDIVILI